MLGLLRATGVLCVYGSGFGMPPTDGYLRIVFLASPEELREIYRLMAEFTADFLGVKTVQAIGRRSLARCDGARRSASVGRCTSRATRC